MIPAVQAPDKICEACGATFNRKRYGDGKTLEDMGRYRTRRFCSQSCGNTKTVVTKDALHWRARKFKQAACQECRRTDRLHVHHLDRNPANNAPTNLTTLCATCHLKRHWREDRQFRVGQLQRREPQPCVMCGELFHPRHSRIQTCSPMCKAALLSTRTTEFRQRTGVSTRQRSTDGRWSSAG